MFKVALVLTAYAATLAAQPDSACAENGPGKTHVRVVSRSGWNAPSAVISLRAQTAPQTVRRLTFAASTGPSPAFVINDVPCGDYEMTVRAPLLMSARVAKLSITSREQWITLVCDEDAPIDYRGPPPPAVIVGQLTVEGRPEATCWVKVTGVYATEVFETECDSQGAFSLSVPQPGSYVVILTALGRDPETRVVKLNRGTNRVKFILK